MDTNVPKFDLSATRRRVSRGQMFEALARFATTHGKPYSASAYKASSPAVSIDVLVREFGSFRAACVAAGLATDGMKQDYTDEELLAYFEKLIAWRAEKGHTSVVPSILDFRNHRLENGDGLSADAFKRRFGDYKRFLALYQRYHNKELTRQALIELAKKPSKPPRGPIGAALRAEVLKRDNYRCTSCGISTDALPAGAVLEVDHVVPVSHGGSSDRENLTTRCGPCNRGKSDRFVG